MRELGQVTARQGGYVIVEICDESSCNLCEFKHNCAKPIKRRVRIFDKENRYPIGTVVRISSSPSKYLLAAFLLFILPLLFLVGFYFIGEMIFKSESKAILFSLLGMIIVYFFIFVLLKIKRIMNFFNISRIDFEY